MKAIVLDAYGGSDKFRLADLPIPPLRGGDVRIKVRSISFNPVDYQIRKGGPESAPVTSPILGMDISGTIEAVGDDALAFRVGEDVFGYIGTLGSSGAYAEYISVPAELVARKPSLLTHDQAAAVPVAAITASLALEKGKLDASRSLFVAGGAGGVGTFVMMLARQQGIERLVTTAGSPQSRAYLIEKCDLVDKQILNYRDGDFVAQALGRNGGAFDQVIDLVGGVMLSACCQLVAIDGHLVSVTDPPSPTDFEFLFRRNASFHPVGANAYMLAEERASWRKYQDRLAALARLFESGELRPPHVSNLGSLSVETVRHAHELLERSAVQGKLVMSCD